MTFLQTCRGRRAATLAGLCSSVSMFALLAGGNSTRATNLKSLSSVPITQAASIAQQAAAAQAAAAAQQAQQSLARAAAALKAARDAQQAAQSLASTLGVKDGIAAGGLMPAGGIASDPSLWQGASLPTQKFVKGRTQVDIQQTQQKAILNWQTFNVGHNTTLNFDQDASDWTVLNRVSDPAAAPSTILGQITAKGGVYVINQNGIIFGAGSQINVHALVASDLDVGALGMTRLDRDNFFLQSGIANGTLAVNSFSIGGTDVKTKQIGGGILVQPGAVIETDIVSPDSPGFAYLFGSNVANYGTIDVPGGEAALVSARAITLTPGSYSAANFPTNVLPTNVTFRGTGFQIQQYASSYNFAGTPGGGPYLTGPNVNPGSVVNANVTGSVANDGLIETPRGIVLMAGDRVSIGAQGVISADTSITRNSMVLLHAATDVTVDGTISMLPLDNGETLPQSSGSGSTVQSFMPPYIEATAPEQVTIASSGLVSAPSASVSINIVHDMANLFGGFAPNTSLSGPLRVLLEPGATIDVAGLQNVELPASYNFISFQPRAEFADMPLQRSGPLYGQTLWIDIRASGTLSDGTLSDGTSWVGTPLADASGYVNAVGRSIFQLMTVGGNVSLTTTQNTNVQGQEAVLQPGSVINTAGGSIQYLPGWVPTTRLIGSDGRIYTMENADPNMTYVGIAGQFTAAHPRWGVNETWTTLTTTYAPGYTEGQNAGGVNVTTLNPVLAGTLLFGSVPGEREIAAGNIPSQGSLALTTASTVIIGANAASLPAGFDSTSPALPAPNPTPLPVSVSSDEFKSKSAYQTVLSANELSGYGLSALSITSNDLVLTTGSTLHLAPGGQFSVTTGGAIDIAGTVAAASGTVSLKTDGLSIANSFGSLFQSSVTLSGALMPSNVFVEGILDVSGQWTNDTGRFGNDASGPAFINGGTITISTNTNSKSNIDTTGSILLAAGSLLDISSGGHISAKGTPKTVSTGLMAGAGGNISLTVYQGQPFNPPGQGIPTTPTSGSVAVLELDGTMRGYGFANGGTLTLGAAKTITIDSASHPDSASAIEIDGKLVTLPASLFTDDGFGAFVIESTPHGWQSNPQDTAPTTGTIMVAAGTSLKLQQQNLSSVADYGAVPTGTKIATAAPLMTPPDGQRAPVNLTLKSNNILLDTGASIEADPGAVITMTGTPTFANSQPQPQRAANVLLRGSIIDHAGTVAVNAQYTWLDQNALIDLSGILRPNPLFGTRNGPAVSGTVLGGGTFIVEAANLSTLGPHLNPDLSGTYVVSEQGAVVDVSGAPTTVVQVSNPSARGVASTSTEMWSDAGTVSIDTGAFAWGGTFAVNTDPRATGGGTLILGGAALDSHGVATTAISLQQDSSAIAGKLSTPTLATMPTQAALLSRLGLPATTPILAAVDTMQPFANVFLYSGSSGSGATRIFTDLSGSTYGQIAPAFGDLVASGNISWADPGGRVHIAAKTISAGPSQRVAINAGYVLLTGGGGTPLAGKSTAIITGQTIDIEGAAFSGFDEVKLTSSGDIRLSTPKVADGIIGTSGFVPILQDTTTFSGFLDSSGDLVLDAQRVYPVSSVDFFIRTPGNVTFSASAGSNPQIPLSAGGGFTVYAATIDQGGNLFAPLGSITLGDNGTAARNIGGVATTQVTLAPGSLTSVTLVDTVVPYGETVDGTNWYYNASLYPLEARNADGSRVVLPDGSSALLPSKSLVFNSANVTVASKATIDIRGGGDLQAMEFVPGKGGSRDVLATTPAGQTVYALLPSSNDSIAAFDVHLTTVRSSTGSADSYPLAGMQIHIDGGGGIPAGTYTLYPGHYATLPGALRVVDFGSNVGNNRPSGTTLPDGTVLMTGYYTSSTRPGTQSTGQEPFEEELFAVQTGAAWQQYSEYTFSSANSYFVASANHNGVMVPRLPIDAGRIAVNAQQSLVLAGTIAAQPAPGGRGSELDVSALKLVVSPTNPIGVEPDYQVGDGWVWVSVDQLNALGLESVLLGGLRTDQADGSTLITPATTEVAIDTRGTALSVPELLLAAVPQPSVVDQTVAVGSLPPVEVKFAGPADPNSGEVRIVSGSVIESVGTVDAGFGRHYVFSSPTNGSAASLAAALRGTLSGTEIDNAILTNLPLFINGRQAAGPAAVPPLFYGGLGALFVASNDSRLTVSGPAGDPTPALTIRFRPVPGFGAVTGAVTVAGSDAGRISIEAGTRASTQTLTLQATKQTNAIDLSAPAASNPSAPPAVLDANQINIVARSVGFETNPSPGRSEALLLSQTNLGQLAGAESLFLKAWAGPMTFYGDVAFEPGAAMQNLTLDTRTFVGTGSDAKLAIGGTITLVNSSSASEAASTSTSGAFEIDASKIVLGGGTQTIAGFSNINWTAAGQVDIAAPGALALVAPSQAAVDIEINTPLVTVGGLTGATSGAQFALTTSGAVTINRPADPQAPVSRPDDSSDLGGNLVVTAASIQFGEVDANGQPLLAGGIIQAQAGNITLHATSGDITLNPGAYIAAGGYKKTFRDVDTYAPGGKVSLQADAGSVNMGHNSVVDVAQPAGGLGYGGEIDITALNGNAALSGALLGSGGAGHGGIFKLDINGAANLDNLASALDAGGVSGAIDIHTRTGNLVLSAGSTLKANSITLTADDQRWNNTDGDNGQIIIAGKIDASGSSTNTLDGAGQAGGQVSLYGYNAVVLAATADIDASTAHANERGGDVVFGIGTNASGYIDLQGGTINVSGGQGGVGGTLYLRAPIIPGNANGQGDVRINWLASALTGARAVTVEPYITLSTDGSVGLNGSAFGWNGIIDPANSFFFNNTVPAFIQGNTVYGFAGTFARLTPLAQQLGAGVVSVQPGLELVNTNATVNNGDITIASNWNLAAGTAYDLKTSGGITYYDYNSSTVKLDYRLYPSVYGPEVGALFGVSSPGVLTLRASGSVNVNASISDGFFQFRNYLDPTYTNNLSAYLFSVEQLGMVRGMDGVFPPSGVNRYLDYLNIFDPNSNVPIAPYDQTGNGISPSSQALASADLFPHSLMMCLANCGTSQATKVQVVDPGSWSYRFTAGADVGSANPAAMQSLATVGTGSVIVNNHTTYTQALYNDIGGGSSTPAFTQVNLPTLVRTGTGDISIAAARDVILNDTTAPGTIYSAGVNTAQLPDPQYKLSGTSVSAQNPDGFFEPQVLAYGLNNSYITYGPPTAAAFPENGGDVNIVAQRDFIGFNAAGSADQTSFQLFFPWLLADAAITPVPKIATISVASSVRLMGAGVFAPTGASIASQSAWWIEYGSFQQDVLSAGGNVTLTVGRDMRDVSVSLPTTGRVTGGLSLSSTPQTHVYGSGDLSVQVGRDLLGGALYEGSGHASVVVRGSVGQLGNLVDALGASSVNYPLLAVDSGQIALAATGSVTIAGVVNPAEIHHQAPSLANPISVGVSAGNDLLYMDTYGPNSATSIVAVGGNLTIGVAPSQAFYNRALDLAYPSSFEALALSGDIKTVDMANVPNSGNAPISGIVLSGSPGGTFQLLAQGSIDLTGGFNPTCGCSRPLFSAGPSLLDAAFNPFRPNDGFSGSVSSPVLAHQDDTEVAHIYALTGDISGVGSVTSAPQANGVTISDIQRMEINSPAEIYAGRDIVDLNVIVQNITASDVSSVEAGRDIHYTGFNLAGGLQVAGPGFFVVQAGRDLGPFLPATHDNPNEAVMQQGITAVGNASFTPVGNRYVNQASPGMYDETLLGPVRNTPKLRNPLLAPTSADLIVQFGVADGIDYNAMASVYVDPANAANVPHNYLPELQSFLAGIGVHTTGPSDAWDAFRKLPTNLQYVFLDQVFDAELKAVGRAQTNSSGNYKRGYEAINTLFPASLGYTANSLGGGSNGANQLVKTGDLDMLHATIQTQQGGDVSVMGPGGNILVGSLATEPNQLLKLNNLGIITLDGGAINTFTDQSVLVNSSRVFTEQGGDILLWSSNGNLDAGRGAKTTLSLPPLQVFFNQDDYQSIDLGGLVTGAGIGVLKTSSSATTSDLFLLAPRGTVDAGTAGIRASGNVVIAANVVFNVSNIQYGGSAIIPGVVSVPNIGALTSASSAAGAATKNAETPTGAGGPADQASVFIVEVIGYGGGGDNSEATPPGDASSPGASTPPADTTSPGETKKRDRH